MTVLTLPARASTAPDAARPRSYKGPLMGAGLEAEQVVMAWIDAFPHVDSVTDLRGVKAMREADVDCSVRLRDGRIVLAEIKSDSWLGKTGNMLFESLRINHTAPPDRAVTLGWSARSPATWLFYYAPSLAKVYQIRMNEFRAACQGYTQAARKGTRLDFIETDHIKSTVNILIPEEIVAEQDSFHTYDLKHP